jgi:hypothetical protein
MKARIWASKLSSRSITPLGISCDSLIPSNKNIKVDLPLSRRPFRSDTESIIERTGLGGSEQSYGGDNPAQRNGHDEQTASRQVQIDELGVKSQNTINETYIVVKNWCDEQNEDVGW